MIPFCMAATLNGVRGSYVKAANYGWNDWTMKDWPVSERMGEAKEGIREFLGETTLGRRGDGMREKKRRNEGEKKIGGLEFLAMSLIFHCI